MTQKGPETRAKAKEKQIDYEKAFPVFHTREEILTKMYDLIDCPSWIANFFLGETFSKKLKTQ